MAAGTALKAMTVRAAEDISAQEFSRMSSKMSSAAPSPFCRADIIGPQARRNLS